MSRFWSTSAIVNAIVMTTGEVDGGTILLVCAEVVLLVQLYRAVKHERVGA